MVLSSLFDGYPSHDDVEQEQREIIENDDIPIVEGQQLNLDRFGPMQDLRVKQDINVISVHKVLKILFRKSGKETPKEINRMGS